VESHLNQSLTIRTLEYTTIPRPVKATYDKNALVLRQSVWRPTKSTIVGYPTEGQESTALSFDTESTRAAIKGKLSCDICTILKRQNAIKFDADPDLACTATKDSDTCRVCKYFEHPCTFTPSSLLVTGWLGFDPAEQAPGTGGFNKSDVRLPLGKSPMRVLLPHATAALRSGDQPQNAQQVLGWELMTAMGQAVGEDEDEDEGDSEDNYMARQSDENSE
jgi:hypothetical protein